MTATRPRVVVTHWVHPEVQGYLAEFCDPVIPSREKGVWPASIPERLLRHPRTLFTPHLGSAVDDVRQAMSLQAARQVGQVLEGRRPDHPVNEP
jgi:lactate dehydrogenase-like 2-hydroxyacid dehydrogenase